MSASTSNLVNDLGSLTNFKAYGTFVSGAFTAGGWQQSTDTGQVNWSTISSVPGSGSSVYEVWEPNDTLQNFYVRIDYHNQSGHPSFELTVATSTDGAGNCTGTVVGPYETLPQGNSDSLTYPCYYSAGAGRIHVMMWRGGSDDQCQMFSIERSLNSSGAYTGSHVTLITSGQGPSNGSFNQQTLLFGVGAAPPQSLGNVSYGGMAVNIPQPNNNTSVNFNGSVPFDTTKPLIGYYDYPLTGVGAGNPANFTEGQIFTTSLYGSTRTYIATLSNALTEAGPNRTSIAFCMRYD